jgi:hypothetical protein
MEINGGLTMNNIINGGVTIRKKNSIEHVNLASCVGKNLIHLRRSRVTLHTQNDPNGVSKRLLVKLWLTGIHSE